MTFFFLFSLWAHSTEIVRSLHSNQQDFLDYRLQQKIKTPEPVVTSHQIDQLLQSKDAMNDFWRRDWPSNAISIFAKALQHRIIHAQTLHQRKEAIELLGARSNRFKSHIDLKRIVLPSEQKRLNQIKYRKFNLEKIREAYQVIIDSERIEQDIVLLRHGRHRISFFSSTYQTEHHIVEINDETQLRPSYRPYASGHCLSPVIDVPIDSEISQIFYSKNCVLVFKDGKWQERKHRFKLQTRSKKAHQQSLFSFKFIVGALLGLGFGLLIPL